MTFDAGSGRIVRDGILLSTDAIPDRLIGRHEQAEQLGVCLAPMLNGLAPMNAWLHGPPGGGKTSLARTIANQSCPNGASRLNVYVNCWQRRTLHSVLQAVIKELRILGAEAHDASIKLNRIHQTLRDRPMVVILDEIDRPMPSQREEIIRGLLGLPEGGVVVSSSCGVVQPKNLAWPRVASASRTSAPTQCARCFLIRNNRIVEEDAVICPLTISLKTLAARLDASRSSVRRWLNDAGIRPIAMSDGAKGAIRYRWPDVQAWLETRERVE